jgi:hypothetical protein
VTRVDIAKLQGAPAATGTRWPATACEGGEVSLVLRPACSKPTQTTQNDRPRHQSNWSSCPVNSRTVVVLADPADPNAGGVPFHVSPG